EALVTVDVRDAFRRVSSFLERQRAPQTLGDEDAFIERYKRDSRLRIVVREIDQVEQQIINAMRPRQRIATLIAAMFMGNKQVMFSDSSIEVASPAAEPISLAELSSGEKQALRILVDTVLAGPSVLIIDEPELSMHIDWQRQLVAYMRELSPDSQL